MKPIMNPVFSFTSNVLTGEGELREILNGEGCLQDFDNTRVEDGRNVFDTVKVFEFLAACKNNGLYSHGKLPDILRYGSLFSPFQFLETRFERDFLKKIYDYQVVWVNSEGYKVVFIAVDSSYDDSINRIYNKIFPSDPMIIAGIIQDYCPELLDCESIEDALDIETIVRNRVLSLCYHVVQRDNQIWKVVAPVLQHFLNPNLKLPHFNIDIKQALPSIKEFKTSEPVSYEKSGISREYVLRDITELLEIKHAVSDYIIEQGRTLAKCEPTTYSPEFNYLYVEDIVCQPVHESKEELPPPYWQIKDFLYHQEYGKIFPFARKYDNTVIDKPVFHQFITYIHCIEKNVLDRNSLAQKWWKTLNQVNPKENLVWTELLYSINEYNSLPNPYDPPISDSIPIDFTGVQCYEGQDTWVLMKDDIIAWTIPEQLNYGGEFLQAEFTNIYTNRGTFGFIEDKNNNVYVYPQKGFIKYGNPGAGAEELSYSLSTIIQQGLRPLSTTNLNPDIQQKITEIIQETQRTKNLKIPHDIRFI